MYESEMNCVFVQEYRGICGRICNYKGIIIIVGSGYSFFLVVWAIKASFLFKGSLTRDFRLHFFFIGGVVGTGNKFITGVVDTAEK